MELLIKVTDVNDNAPQFEQEEYSFNLKENNDQFSAIVAAKDADENGTENAVVRYRIVRGDTSGNFTIDPVTGLKMLLAYDSVIKTSKFFQVK